MYAIDKNRLQMFRRVRDLARSGTVAPEFEKSLTNFEATIDRLTELAAQQELQGRLALAATTRARLMAVQLRTQMLEPVVRIGRSFLPRAGAEAESIRSALTLGAASDYEGLMASAEGLARLVTQYEAKFSNAGLPTGHAKQIVQLAGQLRAAIDGRGQEQGKRTAATRGMREATSEALHQLRILSSLMVPQFSTNAEWMASWRTATVVARGGARTGGSDAARGDVAGGEVASGGETSALEVKAA